MTEAACYNCGATERVVRIPTFDSVVITCSGCVERLTERLNA